MQEEGSLRGKSHSRGDTSDAGGTRGAHTRNKVLSLSLSLSHMSRTEDGQEAALIAKASGSQGHSRLTSASPQERHAMHHGLRLSSTRRLSQATSSRHQNSNWTDVAGAPIVAFSEGIP